MARFNALASFIALMHGDRAETISQAAEAFAVDFGHFARANNGEALATAAKALAKGPKDKALAQAMHDGAKAAGLAVGYVGAHTGPFAKQPDDVRAHYESAITAAVEAFTACLEASEAFAAKAPKTDADKAKAKAEKEAKAQEAQEALITAKVQAGELVRATDIKPLEAFGALALCEALQALTVADPEALRPEALQILQALSGYEALALQAAALATERADALAQCEALATEVQALKAAALAKPAKVRATAKA